tara:strand:+ start:639 stop:1391 length:753 start_codon:yes stop_codon:yes gene_type:complete
MFGLSFMSMAITPGSVIIFGFTTVPILIMSMLTMIRDAFIHFFPSIEYYSWNVLWFLMKVYTYVTRRTKQCARTLHRYFTKPTSNQLYIIKDGTTISKIPFATNNKNATDDYDMVLLQWHVTDESSKYKSHMIRSTTIEDVTDSFVISDECFIGIYVLTKVNDTEIGNYSIIFGSDNYYIVGNILFDRSFVKYLLRRYFEVALTDKQTYEVSFFDNKVGHHKMKEPEYVQITKTGFNIVNPDITLKQDVS